MSRLQEYEDYMAEVGGPKLTIITPCCRQSLAVLVPKVAGYECSTHMVCPHCEARLFKTATKDTIKLTII